MTSPENQRHAIESYVLSRGDRIVDWDEGIDESGSSRKSAWWPKLDVAIARMERGEIDVIVVWMFSRVARHRLKWATALDRVDAAGGALESATEHTDATPSGRFTRGMHGEMNAYQAEIIGETWREAHDRRRRHGLPATGGKRWGYQSVDGAYVVDPDIAPIVADIYRRYLAGAGITQLTRHLNEHGIPTNRGKRWTYQSLFRALDSGFAAGLLGRSNPSKSGGAALPPVRSREFIPGAHEPIVDRVTWDAYVAQRVQRGDRRVRSPERYLLTGLVRCGDCGGRMHGKAMAGERHYTCTPASQTNGLRKITIRSHIVDAAIEDWLFRLGEDVDHVASIEELTREKREAAEFSLRSLHRRIDGATEQITRLTVKLAKGTIDDEAYESAVADIQKDRSEARRALQLAAPNPERESAPARVPREIRRLWPRMDNEKKAAVLRPLVECVLVSAAKGSGSYSSRLRIVGTWEARQPGQD